MEQAYTNLLQPQLQAAQLLTGASQVGGEGARAWMNPTMALLGLSNQFGMPNTNAVIQPSGFDMFTQFVNAGANTVIGAKAAGAFA